MTKSKLNDYTAFSNVFRDSLLGVLISTGLLSTLVPNSIEAVGKVQDLNSFLTLNLFSVIYFVFPILVFTSYWLFRGERMFFVEKFNKIEFEHNRVHELKQEVDGKIPEDDLSWVKTLLFVAKVVPLAVFIYNEEAFAGWGEWIYTVTLYYFALAVAQNSYCVKTNRIWLFDQALGLGEKRVRSFQYWSYCVNALVFFLDIIIGIALVMFSRPWIFYSNTFYQWIALIIVIYALGSLIYSFVSFRTQRLRLEDYAVAVLLASAGVSIPSVNLHNHETVSWIAFVGFVVVGALWVLSKEPDTGQRVAKIRPRKLLGIMIPAVMTLIGAAMFNLWMISGNKYSNLAYMTKRLEASQQLSTNEYYPLSNDTTISLDLSLEIHKGNIIPVRLRNSLTWSGHPDTVNLRSKFFPKYVHEYAIARKDVQMPAAISLATKYFRRQKLIDDFYDSIYHMAEDSIKPSSLHSRYASPKYAVVRSYAHPLDYMGARLKRLKNNKEDANDMIGLTEELLRISLMRKARAESNRDSSHWASPSLTTEEQKVTANRLNELKKASPELADDETYQINGADSAFHARLVRFHKLYYEFCELKYIEAYKGAQKVYRSYLVDTQRIGVWVFFVTLLVLALATFLNNRARQIFQDVNRDNENTEHRPLDSPRNALFIQTVAIFILLVPLLKPIEPEHIDPEKTYWMISLQSWHTPSFIKAITDQDEENHTYVPGRTLVITQPLDFTELSNSLNQLSSGISNSVAELDSIQKELMRMRMDAKNRDDVLKRH